MINELFKNYDYKLTDKEKKELEKSVEKKMKNNYRKSGYEVYGIQSKLGCEGGVSDIMIIKNEETTFIEIKSPSAFMKKNHNLSDSQIKFLKSVGGFVATIIEGEIVLELVK